MLVGALLNMVGTWIRAIAIVCPVGVRFPVAMIGQVIFYTRYGSSLFVCAVKLTWHSVHQSSALHHWGNHLFIILLQSLLRCGSQFDTGERPTPS